MLHTHCQHVPGVFPVLASFLGIERHHRSVQPTHETRKYDDNCPPVLEIMCRLRFLPAPNENTNAFILTLLHFSSEAQSLLDAFERTDLLLTCFVGALAADIISTVEFNHTGELLATGDKGGRVVIFQQEMEVQAPVDRLNVTVASL